jgi:sugar lactone lactonase YvrE
VLRNSSILDDGVPATSVHFDPVDSAIDRAGNLYIADAANSRVRKVTPDGLIHTVAGTGRAGFNGDGGPAMAAELSLPTGIALDLAGNVYVADSGNSRLRKITPEGVIETIAGVGTPGFSGDGGLARDAQLGDALCGLAVDRFGSIYVAECNIGYDVAGGIGPKFDCSATVVLESCRGHRVRRITADGIISTVAGNGTFGFSGDFGPGTAAQLNLLVNAGYSSSALAVDYTGNLYIADVNNKRIRRVDRDGVITTVAYGTPPIDPNEEGGRLSVAVDSLGNLYVADNSNRIWKIAANGVPTHVVGIGENGIPTDGVPAVQAPLNDPYDVTVDHAGNLYVTDRNHRVLRVSTGEFITGYIGGFTQQGPSLYLSGWACVKSHKGSIDIDLYAGGPGGQGGTLVARATANQPSEEAVANACETDGANYRFMIPISPSIQQQFAGQPIYVHGISPFPELPNSAILNSGNVGMPER